MLVGCGTSETIESTQSVDHPEEDEDADTYEDEKEFIDEVYEELDNADDHGNSNRVDDISEINSKVQSFGGFKSDYKTDATLILIYTEFVGKFESNGNVLKNPSTYAKGAFKERYPDLSNEYRPYVADKLKQLSPDSVGQNNWYHIFKRRLLRYTEGLGIALSDWEDMYVNPSILSPPAIDMTEEEVLLSDWGEPEDINKTTTKHGVKSQWVYPDFKYIYFEDGVVTTIQE